MSSLHEKLEEGDDDHELTEKINKETRDDDYQEEKNDILQKDQINEEQEVKKQKGSEMSSSVLHEKLKKDDDNHAADDDDDDELNDEMNDDDHQEERDDILQKEINEEQEVFKKQKEDEHGDDRSASVHEKLKELDDGTFDKKKKEIELETAGNKQKTERLLTMKIVEDFVLAHQNAHKDRQEVIKLKVSKKVKRNFYHHLTSAKALELHLVIEKTLTDSELSDDNMTDQFGLSIPNDCIKHHLSKQEIEKIDKEGGLEVTLWEILTTSNVLSYTLILKKLGTDYVLTGEYWNEFRRRNRKKFRRADGGNSDIQLLSYRIGLRLNFSLFVVKEEPKSGVASTD